MLVAHDEVSPGTRGGVRSTYVALQTCSTVLLGIFFFFLDITQSVLWQTTSYPYKLQCLESTAVVAACAASRAIMYESVLSC